MTTELDETTTHHFHIAFEMTGEDAQRGVAGIVADLNVAINDHGLLGGNFIVSEAHKTTGIAPGTKLPNGATVLLSAGPGAGDYCVVLADTGHRPNGKVEYVTWRVAPDTLDAFWGDYFGDDLPAACESFLARGFGYGTSRFNAA